MSAKQPPSNQHDEATLGVGGETSGETGERPAHDSQRETGGSGGSGLTGSQVGEEKHAVAKPAAPLAGEEACDLPAEAIDSGMGPVARGPQDTRSEQGGWTRTGLGAPETGGNQSVEDLERHKKKE